MKNPGIIAPMLGWALLVPPVPTQAQLSYEQAVAYCKSLGEMAATIMENRQLGVPPQEQMATVAAMESEHWQQLGAKLIEVAYQTAASTNTDVQQRVSQDFRSEYENACYKMYLD